MDKIHEICAYWITSNGTKEIDAKTHNTIKEQKCLACNCFYKDHENLQKKFQHPYTTDLQSILTILPFDDIPLILH